MIVVRIKEIAWNTALKSGKYHKVQVFVIITTSKERNSNSWPREINCENIRIRKKGNY